MVFQKILKDVTTLSKGSIKIDIRYTIMAITVNISTIIMASYV